MAVEQLLSAKLKSYPDDSSWSAQTYRRAERVMPTGTTRGQTFYPPHLIYVDHAEGCRVTDVDGNSRLDFVNNFTVQLLGHSHPTIVEAVRHQAARAISCHLPHPSEVDLAEALAGRARSFERIRYANSGSEAVMHALKAARAYTGRPKIAKVEGLYHGSYDFAEVSLDSAPATWGGSRPASVGYSRGVPQNILDDVVVIPFNDVVAARAILGGERASLAAVLIDLYPSRIGYLPMSREFVGFLRDFTREIGALLICDEVVSFRIHTGGAQTQYGLHPDLTTLGKIIGGGLPIGAVAGPQEFMSVFETPGGRKALLPHSGTFTGNPLSMVAGLATLRLYDSEAAFRLGELGEKCRVALRQAFSAAAVQAQVTGIHSLFSIQFAPAPFDDFRSLQCGRADRASLGDALFRRLLNRGVLFSASGLGCLSTPMTGADVEQFAEAVHLSLRDMKSGGLTE